MNTTDLPDQIRSFVVDLLERGVVTWLIGSRVNPTSKPPNDWDLMVFGNAALLEQLRSARPVPDLDILVVVDGENFESPWTRASDGVVKKGSLTNWKWAQTGSDTATYEGTKWPDDWGTTKIASRLIL